MNVRIYKYENRKSEYFIKNGVDNDLEATPREQKPFEINAIDIYTLEILEEKTGKNTKKQLRTNKEANKLHPLTSFF